MKRHTNFFYLIGQGFKSTFKHGFMSFAAVCITVACLVIINSFVLVCFNVNQMVEDLQRKTVMIAIVDETYSEQEAKHLGSQINLIDNVYNAEFRSNAESLESYVQDYESSLFDGLAADAMRHQFIVTLEDNSKVAVTKAEIEEIDGIADVYADIEVANALSTIRTVIYLASMGVASVLLLVSLIIISNTIKLTMMDRKEEIAIMKMVGATNSFIRLPFVVEGFLLGLFASVISFFIEWGLYELMLSAISSTNLAFLQFAPFKTVFIAMALSCGCAGFFVGIFGSLMSIRRFLKV
ncbi:MAG: permease-like cell division protein FtsX [Oscillospiraceae bacterium]|nr:permease-like cell division protein FtsX [Oscillospiraceae bacterium]